MHIEPAPWSGDPIAVIDGAPLVGSDYDAIRTRGLGVRIVSLPSSESLESVILPARSFLQELDIGPGVTGDLSAVSACVELRDLAIDPDISSPLNLSNCDKLVQFAGSTNKVVFGRRGPETVQAWDSSLDFLSPIHAGTTSLRLVCTPRRDLTVIGFAGAARVTTIEIAEGRTVDLSGLREYPELKHLSIVMARRLTNIFPILEAPNLRSIYLEAAPIIEGFAFLSELTDVRVQVVGKNPFPATFRTLVRDTENWMFPPSKRFLPSPLSEERDEWFFHPALPGRLAASELPDEETSESIAQWTLLPELEQELQIVAFWDWCVDWALTEGADQMSASDAGEAQPLSSGELMKLRQNWHEAHDFVLWSAGQRLLRVDDSVADGVTLYLRGIA